MNKYVAICGTVAALVWAGVALADTPQGKLTGSALISPGPAGSFTFAIDTAVIDGGTSYVGLENDQSGNCAGDSGTVGGYNVVCAHFVASSKCCNVGSPKMRFAYKRASNFFTVGRITDNGASIDTVAIGATLTRAEAEAWVNRGFRGAHLTGLGWGWYSVLESGYTVTASQA